MRRLSITLVLIAAMGMARQTNTPPASAPAASGQMPAAPAPPDMVIRTEKKLVLVDAVVTDKQGNYLHNLAAKDFRVWEDGKEQRIESFSFQADPASPLNSLKHYLILFFDNASMAITDQMVARKAALQFVNANAKPNRLMAVVNFNGSLQVAQNFTEDADRLRQVVAGVKFSSVSPNSELASLGIPSLGSAAADFGARDILLGLRSLAKNLASVPGRKTLVFLSSGFNLNLELRSELTAVIDVCNKSNVAVYPIDVRGLVADVRPPADDETTPKVALADNAFLVKAGYAPPGSAGGGGGGHSGGTPSPVGGGGARGGGTTGTRGGAAGGGAAGTYGAGSNVTQPRSIVPMRPNVTGPQEVLYALATGTGGFVIVNTNDLLGGLQKIGNEQNEFYVLGYSPPETDTEGTCHELKVKAEHGDTVRSRSGYCTPHPLDLLAGTAVERDLEHRFFVAGASAVPASMETPFFYTAANTARVDLAMEIPSSAIKFEKEKGKFHSEVNVLGLAYANDGTVAARFSDVLKLSFDNKKQLEEFAAKPLHYEKQFDVASGSYLLKVGFGAGGESFGKLQSPLIIDAYDNHRLGISALALSKEIHPVTALETGLDAQLLEDERPLVSEGMQLVPAGSYQFDKTQPAALYVEIYEPRLLDETPPKIGLDMKVVDRKTGAEKMDTGFMNIANYTHAGNLIIPVGLKLAVDQFGPGAYSAQVHAVDTAGNKSVVRSVDFDVH